MGNNKKLSAVGDFCAPICQIDDNRKLVIEFVYIKVNQKIYNTFLGFYLTTIFYMVNSVQILRKGSKYLREIFNIDIKNDRNMVF